MIPGGKPKMTKEQRREKYTAIAKKRREKQNQRQFGQFGGGTRNKQIVCYQCRQVGHTIGNCPMNNNNITNQGPENTKNETADPTAANNSNTSTTEILCYRCGSTEHNIHSCPKRNDGNNRNDLPYATCFICNQKGHLASACTQNSRGIYVNGGSCRYCGGTDHLKTDCPEKKKKKKERQEKRGEPDIEELLEEDKPKKSHKKSSRKDKASSDGGDAGNKDKVASKKKRRVVKF